MSTVELRATGRAVQVSPARASGPVLAGRAVPKAMGRWLAGRAGRENLTAASVSGSRVTLEFNSAANGARVAKRLGLTATEPQRDAAVWVGSVFGCEIVARQACGGR